MTAEGAGRFREEALERDAEDVRALVTATGYFRPDEVDVAAELVDERLSRGEQSGYFFLFSDGADGLSGYSCYGPIACSVHSWDLYWIAVDPRRQGQGLGRALLAASEQRIAEAGGRRVYVETSSLERYKSTRAFYEACGYEVAAVLDEFYAPGDGKVIFLKVLAG